MSTQITAPKEKQISPLDSLSNLLNKHKAQIEMALPRHMNPERVIRIALTAFSQTPGLAVCPAVTIAAAVVQASILGLEVNSLLGEAYLVPFWNKKTQRKECQLIPGYKGMLKLARNSGVVSMVDAQVVYSNDEFEFHKGSEVYWKHKWARSGDRGEPEGIWAGYVLKDGSKNFEYWTMEQINRHRDRYSEAAYSKDDKLIGAWADNPEWMGKKTVLKQVIKLMPQSVGLATALSLDELHDVGQPQTFDVLPLLPPGEGEQPLIEGATEPEQPTGPRRKSETVKPTPAAEMDPKDPKLKTTPKAPEAPKDEAPADPKGKPTAAILAEVHAMRERMGNPAWWNIVGNAGITAVEELPTQAEVVVLLGMMQQKAKEMGK